MFLVQAPGSSVKKEMELQRANMRAEILYKNYSKPVLYQPHDATSSLTKRQHETFE
jgi:hypothetical protein